MPPSPNLDVRDHSHVADATVSYRQLRGLMLVLGIILCLGGLAHTVGVVHFYASKGVPDINRVLLDVWIAEAQLLGGVFYLVACRAIRARRPWQIAATCGAVTVSSYAAAFIPVVFSRAPLLFRIPLVIYFVLSVVILVRAGFASRGSRRAA